LKNLRQLDNAWTDEVKDSMVEHLENAIYSCMVEEFNQYVELIKSEGPKRRPEGGGGGEWEPIKIPQGIWPMSQNQPEVTLF
jgi:hypothetical protein